jgi:hypothetical protein
MRFPEGSQSRLMQGLPKATNSWSSRSLVVLRSIACSTVRLILISLQSRVSEKDIYQKTCLALKLKPLGVNCGIPLCADTVEKL